MTYRTKNEVVEHRKNDPVPRFEALLVDAGVISETDAAALKREILEQTNDATDRAETMPFPQAADLYANVYEGAWQPWQ
jgi:TPP-dependent pyruvate/acetoin dehydrogenase alpha subunit